MRKNSLKSIAVIGLTSLTTSVESSITANIFDNTTPKKSKNRFPITVTVHIPSGAKSYRFDSSGNIYESSTRTDGIVFECAAINEKNARKKYNKWVSIQSKTDDN